MFSGPCFLLQVAGLARRHSGLMSLRSVDLSPASWMAVAWSLSLSLHTCTHIFILCFINMVSTFNMLLHLFCLKICKTKTSTMSYILTLLQKCLETNKHCHFSGYIYIYITCLYCGTVEKFLPDTVEKYLLCSSFCV